MSSSLPQGDLRECSKCHSLGQSVGQSSSKSRESRRTRKKNARKNRPNYKKLRYARKKKNRHKKSQARIDEHVRRAEEKRKLKTLRKEERLRSRIRRIIEQAKLKLYHSESSPFNSDQVEMAEAVIEVQLSKPLKLIAEMSVLERGAFFSGPKAKVCISEYAPGDKESVTKAAAASSFYGSRVPSNRFLVDYLTKVQQQGIARMVEKSVETANEYEAQYLAARALAMSNEIRQQRLAREREEADKRRKAKLAKEEAVKAAKTAAKQKRAQYYAKHPPIQQWGPSHEMKATMNEFDKQYAKFPKL